MARIFFEVWLSNHAEMVPLRLAQKYEPLTASIKLLLKWGHRGLFDTCDVEFQWPHRCRATPYRA